MKTSLPIHLTKLTSILARIAPLFVAAAILTGCGSGLSGTYENDGIYKKLKFTSGNKVEMTSASDIRAPPETG